MRTPAARVLLLLTLARAASAQEIRGIVRDSATRAPVPGAVVMVMDGADMVLSRNLTNQPGEYRIASTRGEPACVSSDWGFDRACCPCRHPPVMSPRWT